MRPSSLLVQLLWLSLSFSNQPRSAALQHPIEIKGYKFFDSVTGEEFVARGIDYYPRPNGGKLNHNSLDLFSNEHSSVWKRDIEHLKALGVNAIRLYAVNATYNHDEFMCALGEAGIYVIVALAHDCPTCAITRDAAPDCYPPELKQQGQEVIQAFAHYPNTLAFSAGNEVNHFAPPSQPEWNAPCQKKFIRDMRKYLAQCPSTRQIPIGLVSADNVREEVAQYYNCEETDEYDRAEWYGLNSYVSCDFKAQEYSDALGFQLLEQSFTNLEYSIPVFLTEFGCLSDTYPTIDGYECQRDFKQAKWLLTEPSLREQFNGGFAFEYSMESQNAQIPYPFQQFGHQNYGIGYFSPKDCDDINTPCQYNPLPSYKFLQDIYINSGKTYSSSVTKEDFSVTEGRALPSPCPERFDRLDSFVWEADQQEFLSCPVSKRTDVCATVSSASQGTTDETSNGTPNITPSSDNQITTISGQTDNATEVSSSNATADAVEKSEKLEKELEKAKVHEKISLSIAIIVTLVAVGMYYGCMHSSTAVPVEWLQVPGPLKHSEESAGLLSMKSYQDNADYEALSSDRSLEDTEAAK